ncbi:MAG: hypothetical protein MUC86_13535 [Burkholderiaceae bacterium]|nr:hypothetical protein [Burkholderiaceae bacterium]
MKTARLELRRSTAVGRRLHRSVTLERDGPCLRLGMHVGRCSMHVELAADDLRQLIGMLRCAELELSEALATAAEETA